VTFQNMLAARPPADARVSAAAVEPSQPLYSTASTAPPSCGRRAVSPGRRRSVEVVAREPEEQHSWNGGQNKGGAGQEQKHAKDQP
jgi:hypothetical protein